MEIMSSYKFQQGRLWTSALIDTALPAGTNAIGKLAANDGVDIGDVTINNASGASAVNIQDGGNSITVDGSVTVTQAIGTNLHTVLDSGTLSTITNVVHIDDNAGSLTVDGSVTVTQGTATNLKAQAEVYQGGSAVASGNPLQVTLANTGANAIAVKVDGSAVTQPISATSLPLPTLAATSTKQSDGTQKTQVVDGSGNVIGSTTNALDINIKSGNPTTIAVTQGTGTNLHTVVDSGVITTITNVVHVDDNSSTISVDDGAGSITVDGSVTVTQATGTNLHMVVDSGTITTITNTVHVDDNSGSITVDNNGTFTTQVTSVTPGTSSTSLGKAEDSVFTDGDTGVLTLGVRQDTPINDTSTSGDYGAIKTDSQGRLWINSDILLNAMLKDTEYLQAILIELRVINTILHEGLNTRDSTESLRVDESIIVNNLT
jgi:hypothetical protein